MKYSIVIPCYNEGGNLIKLVNNIKSIAEKYSVEFILVENGSNDNSKEVIKEINHIDGKKIRVVYVEKNKGYGYGLLQGLKNSVGDYLGWIHADMQLPPKELERFFKYIENYSDSRPLFIKGIRKNRSILDCFFTAAMTFFETILFQTYLYDIGAIPVIFDRKLMKKLDKASYDFSIELFIYWKAKKNKFKIVRKKIELVNREKGKSSWNNGIKSKISQSLRIIKASLVIRKGGHVK